jgi:multiple sugar transport system ATP-binding protein
MSQVTLRSLVKRFSEDVIAVNNVNLEIEDKEFIVLVGPSGCGKTTTLRMVAGLEDISGGDILIGDRIVNDVPPKDRNIAMVFQNYALYPHMTVYKNMAFSLKLRKTPKAEIDRRVKNAADILGIGELLERKPKQLSGGQRQRVAVGRAIVRDPEVFLFDEPLSNLDAKLRVNMRAELIKLHERLNATMIYVTHDQVEAMTLGDRIVVLDRGRVQQIAPPLEWYERPSNVFVASFIGSPAMNLVPGQLVRESNVTFQARSNAFSVTLREWPNVAAGKTVVLGVRPEHVHLAGSGEGITGRVELAEPLGNELLLHLSVGEHQLTSRLPPGVPPAAGSTVQLALDGGRIHLFDRESGRRLK